MLNVYGTMNDNAVGFENAADDHQIAEPKKNAIIKMTNLLVGDLGMDPFKRSLTRAGKRISLSVKKYALLEFLMINKVRFYRGSLPQLPYEL